MAAVANRPRRTDTRRFALPKPRKKLIRRTSPDHSQQFRHAFQAVLLVLNLYLGTIFYFWVHQFEGGRRLVAERPPGVEGWLPIGAMMNFRYWLLTGKVPPVHPAAMFLLIAFVAISLLFRKSFCSWLCPIGSLSEMLAAAGRRIFGRNLVSPKWLDIPLRSLKYLLLGFFAWAVCSMSASGLAAFMRSPYGLVADVKMLNFFRNLDRTGFAIIVVLVLGSLLIQNFWCRYLCPYGALMGLASLVSPMRIRRTPSACIDCVKCTRACPSNLPVHKLITIKSAECTGCMECIAICPAEGALGMQMPVHRGRVPAWAIAAAIAAVFLGTVGYAKASHHWKTPIPNRVYQELVPNANQISHPLPGDEALK